MWPHSATDPVGVDAAGLPPTLTHMELRKKPPQDYAGVYNTVLVYNVLHVLKGSRCSSYRP
jgi:hypothetical protein